MFVGAARTAVVGLAVAAGRTGRRRHPGPCFRRRERVAARRDVMSGFVVGWRGSSGGLVVLLARGLVEGEEDSRSRSRGRGMRLWKCLMVVRTGRRVVLGRCGFAAGVAVDSTAAKGERFAGESSYYCGCEQPLRKIARASSEMMRGYMMRRRVTRGQMWETELRMQGSRLRCVDDNCPLPCE